MGAGKSKGAPVLEPYTTFDVYPTNPTEYIRRQQQQQQKQQQQQQQTPPPQCMPFVQQPTQPMPNTIPFPPMGPGPQQFVPLMMPPMAPNQMTSPSPPPQMLFAPPPPPPMKQQGRGVLLPQQPIPPVYLQQTVPQTLQPVFHQPLPILAGSQQQPGGVQSVPKFNLPKKGYKEQERTKSKN